MLWHYIKSEGIIGKTVFNTYLSVGRSNQKVEESGLAFFWPNWSSSDLPNPNTNTQIRKHTNTQIHWISIMVRLTCQPSSIAICNKIQNTKYSMQRSRMCKGRLTNTKYKYKQSNYKIQNIACRLCIAECAKAD